MIYHRVRSRDIFIMTSASNFIDIFKIIDWDPDGHKMDNVSRIVATNKSDVTTLILDIYRPLFPCKKVNDQFTLCLTSKQKTGDLPKDTIEYNGGVVLEQNTKVLTLSFSGLFVSFQNKTFSSDDESTHMHLYISKFSV